ncbi:helix-turn-helix domain-containing protein [Clostridium combesii]|nr:helix-turn-helix transcriptional regulator [Clostridium combesii]
MKLRLSKGLSKEQLAQKIGISTSLISKCENNETNIPISVLIKISESLNSKVIIHLVNDNTPGIIKFINKFNIENEPVKEVYLRYSSWCSENGLKSVSKPVFGREVKKQGYNSDTIIRVNGKQKRVYKKV